MIFFVDKRHIAHLDVHCGPSYTLCCTSRVCIVLPVTTVYAKVCCFKESTALISQSFCSVAGVSLITYSHCFKLNKSIIHSYSNIVG